MDRSGGCGLVWIGWRRIESDEVGWDDMWGDAGKMNEENAGAVLTT